MVPGSFSILINIVPLDQQYLELAGAESEDNTVHRNMGIDRSYRSLHGANVGNKMIKSKVNVKNTLTVKWLEIFPLNAA